MKTVPFDTILALIALDIHDTEQALGDDHCGGDITAAHLCGRLSGLREVLHRVNNLQDPARAWAQGLVAAEHHELIARIRVEAAEHVAKKEQLKEVFDLLDGAERARDPHVN